MSTFLVVIQFNAQIRICFEKNNSVPILTENLGTDTNAGCQTGRFAGLPGKEQSFLFFAHSHIYFAENRQVVTTIQSFAGINGMLSVKDIVFPVTVADLGFVGDTLVKVTDDTLYPLAFQFSLIVLTGSDDLAAVNHHHSVQGFRCHHIELNLLHIVLKNRIRCGSVF